MRKPNSGKTVPSPAKTKMAFSLSAKAVKRLGAACVFFDQNQSELVESLINDNFSGLRVVDDRAKPIVQASPSESNESAKQGHDVTSLAKAG